ncbi:hypothetical protein [Leptospira sp. GIMC2001]|uniref:hypothetical protein n=1 Tax=Leptospira sp. GIMC2001 TaxID=1513297 RepID=UPI00234BF84A|nr:hypothetical protein [Leptospira sp. GIMC2001]WCL50887.1 hypothetical protein O4O04_08770 [Leptospira sp. GIMC2001]
MIKDSLISCEGIASAATLAFHAGHWARGGNRGACRSSPVSCKQPTFWCLEIIVTSGVYAGGGTCPLRCNAFLALLTSSHARLDLRLPAFVTLFSLPMGRSNKARLAVQVQLAVNSLLFGVWRIIVMSEVYAGGGT